MSTILKRPAMMVAAALAAVAGQSFGTGTTGNEQARTEQPLRRFMTQSGSFWYGYTFNYHRGPGWTHAQVKRMAREARNQRRHKLACRAKKARA